MFSHLSIIFIIRRSNINWCSRIICSPSNKLSGESELRKLFSLTFISSLREHSHPDCCDNRDPYFNNQPLLLIANCLHCFTIMFYSCELSQISPKFVQISQRIDSLRKITYLLLYFNHCPVSTPNLIFMFNVHYNVVVCISI